MKKIVTLSIATLLFAGASFAHEGKNCGKGKCCSKKECSKKSADKANATMKKA